MNTIFGKLLEKKSNLTFFSQYGQDEWLYKKLFKSKVDGFFIEIGADDGIEKSNTFFFEKFMGWNGLCIEPSPKRFKLLQNNRKCICENFAIAADTSSVPFMDIRGWGKGLSGIIKNYDDEHKSRIQEEINNPANEGFEIINVPTKPLDILLKEHGITHVDFCTIDTEGSEMEVIKSIDFSACQFDVILVENNYNDSSVSKYLEKNQFKYIKTLDIDDVYFSYDFINSR